MDRIHPGRTDIHFHALPGVDDGPATMEDSLELARLAVRDGTRTVVATPHIRREFLADPSEVADRVAELQERLRAEGIPLSVVPGGELDPEMVPHLTHDELDQIAVGPAGARWLLLEAPFAGLDGLVDASAKLRARGFAVVLAHPERAAGVLAGGCRVPGGAVAGGGRRPAPARAACGGMRRAGVGELADRRARPRGAGVGLGAGRLRASSRAGER